jgi:hypothetical protein
MIGLLLLVIVLGAMMGLFTGYVEHILSELAPHA